MGFRQDILSNWKVIELLDCTKFSIFQKAVVRNAIILWANQDNFNLLGYRNTRNINSFSELIKSKREYINSSDLLRLNQNWGLAFSLTKSKIEIINKISLCNESIGSLFPEISQGLIAYDKYQGQSNEIIKSRAYHFTEFHEGLKYWLWGEDVRRYSISWNGKEYIDYCDGIANPRNPKFFAGKRLLVREITNPSIFAAITDAELYNDPAIIIVKGDSKLLECTCSILNSKLATFYHFNHSPKATKGAFPKILVQDIKEFPIPHIKDSVIDILYDLYNQRTSTDPEYSIIDIENQIDHIVYHLYDLTYDEVLIVDPETPISREKYENFSLE